MLLLLMLLLLRRLLLLHLAAGAERKKEKEAKRREGERFYNISLIEFVCIGIRHSAPLPSPSPLMHHSPSPLCSFVYKQGELCNKSEENEMKFTIPS